jgi:hypothetical protein
MDFCDLGLEVTSLVKEGLKLTITNNSEAELLLIFMPDFAYSFVENQGVHQLKVVLPRKIHVITQ